MSQVLPIGYHVQCWRLGSRVCPVCVVFKLNVHIRKHDGCLISLFTYRQLEGEIAEEWNVENMDTLLPLVRDVVAFDMQHSAEIQACDLLMEIDRLDLLTQHMDQSNYPRVCLYLIGYVLFIVDTLFTLYWELAFACGYI